MQRTRQFSSISDHKGHKCCQIVLSFLDPRGLSCIRMGATISLIPQTNYKNGKTLMDLSAIKILYYKGI